MLIYLVRHPRPEATAGLCYGRRDVRVDPEETGRVARYVRAHVPSELIEAAPIHSSPLGRCAALARELAPERAPVIAPELLELDFGSWEGTAWNDVPRDELDAWAQDPWQYAPGGGESARTASSRFHAWAQRLQDEDTSAVIAVTHAGLIRVALSIGSVDPSGLGLSIPYGSVHLLVADRSGVSRARRACA